MGEKSGIVNIVQSHLCFTGNLRIEVKNFGGCILQRFFQGFDFFGVFGEIFLQVIHFGDEIRIVSDLLPNGKALLSLNDDCGIAIWQNNHFDDFGECSHLIQVFPIGVVLVRLNLRTHPDVFISFLCLLDQANGSLPTYGNRNDYPRKKYGISHGKNWNLLPISLLGGGIILFISN